MGATFTAVMTRMKSTAAKRRVRRTIAIASAIRVRATVAQAIAASSSLITAAAMKIYARQRLINIQPAHIVVHAAVLLKVILRKMSQTIDDQRNSSAYTTVISIRAARTAVMVVLLVKI
jgi:hypothetical protein